MNYNGKGWLGIIDRLYLHDLLLGSHSHWLATNGKYEARLDIQWGNYIFNYRLPSSVENFCHCYVSQFQSRFPHMVWHLLFIAIYLSLPLYYGQLFTSSLTLLTFDNIWQLNTDNYSATFTIRTDMELIAAFLFPICQVTWNCPWLNPARFPIGTSHFLWVFDLMCLYISGWLLKMESD